MSRTGKWNAVQEVDSRQLANAPMTPSNDFVDEIDMNPSAPRRPFWMDRNWMPTEKRESFSKDLDTDTVDENWCLKEVIVGAIIERRSSGGFTGWSIVLRTVIRWEERRMRTSVRIITVKNQRINNVPLDIQRWEEQHGEFKPSRSRRRNMRRSRKRSA